MSEQPGELRKINWCELFPFTRIFKTFRVAFRPGKLGLALAGVILMGLLGGLLDGLWPSSVKPVGQELWAYWQVPDIQVWREQTQANRQVVMQKLYGPTELLKDKAPDPKVLNSPQAVKRALAQLKEKFRDESAKIKDKAAIAALAKSYGSTYNLLAPYRTRGVFASFLEYEQVAIDHFLDEARKVVLLDWWSVARNTNVVIGARYLTPDVRRPGDFDDIGMIGTVLLMLRGCQWLFAQHPVFAVLFGLGSLAIWSVFGGAICRMAALNTARDEQIAPRAALEFASRKFLAFFTAPLLPLILIGGIGLALWLGGFLVLQIPYLGELIGGPLMILALLGGFVMALVLIGAAFGGGLLWPTIAVEGSDGFDAMSRSYNYFYARPWRLIFYTIVASVYAGLTYLALRYFVFIMLRLTRFFVGAGAAVWTSRPAGGIGATKIDAIWPVPRPDNLLGRWSDVGFAQVGWDSWAGLFVWLWVLLIVLTLCAYLVSFFFSAATIIYTLLRQQVDATDYEDVFVEEDEEEFGTPASGSLPAADEPASV